MTDRLHNGMFITLEGGEGAGKSTLAQSLVSCLTKQGHRVELTREPGGTPGAEALRSIILTPPENIEWSSLSQTLLFYAARRDHLEKRIVPALKHGAVVICDRFSDSTRAYQAAAGGVPASEIDAIDQVCVGSYQPDLTLVLDISYEDGLRRRQGRGGPTDAFEKEGEAFHQRVRQAFLDIAEINPKRCQVIDANRPPELVLANCVDIISQRLPAK